MAPPKRDLAERLWEKIDKRGPDDCWEWTACKVNGYGRIQLGRKCLKAHRVVYFLATGKDPAGSSVLHSCDNPPCCNPKHLSLGTDRDNMDHRRQRGRNALFSGENNGGAKLTRALVQSLREKYSLLWRGPKGGIRPGAMAALVEEAGVHHSTLMKAIKGKTWK